MLIFFLQEVTLVYILRLVTRAVMLQLKSGRKKRLKVQFRTC